MARILANVLLLRHAGHLSLWSGGAAGADSDEYLTIVRRARV